MSARSYLFVPADREEMLAKAATRGADALIVDLEDAVAPASKSEARHLLAGWMDAGVPLLPGGVWVRVNNDPGLLAEDLDAIAGYPIAGVFLPKVEDPADLARIRELSAVDGLAVVAMIESAAGVLAATRIAASGLTDRLAMGEVDLVGDLGMDRSSTDQELHPIRMQLILASAAAALPPPVGPVHTDIADTDGLRRSTTVLRRLGLWSRPAIHPAQIASINEGFTPSRSEVDAARRLVTSFDQALQAGRGVCVDDRGRMVDEAVVRSARRIVEAATAAGL